jgi:uncharacterized OB-fold protein
MRGAFLQIALLIFILVVSAALTHFFARAMYLTCSKCGTLNARRRTRCRHCGRELRSA